MNTSKCYLLADALSVFHHDKKPIRYGIKGEKLKVVSDHGQVLIVEDRKGQRYPVQAAKVTGR